MGADMSSKIHIDQIPIDQIAKGFKAADWPRVLGMYSGYCAQAVKVKKSPQEPKAWALAVCAELERRESGRSRKPQADWFMTIITTYGEPWLEGELARMAGERAKAVAAPALTAEDLKRAFSQTAKG